MLDVIDFVLEYLPLMFIALYAMTELNCKNYHQVLLCKFVLVLLLWYVFYLLVHKMRIDKDVAFVTTCVLWIVATYVRRNYIDTQILQENVRARSDHLLVDS